MEIIKIIDNLKAAVIAAQAQMKNDAIIKCVNEILEADFKSIISESECSSCPLCMEENDLLKVECCSANICNDCKIKVNKCPYCRVVWDEEKNKEDERILRNRGAINLFVMGDMESATDSDLDIEPRPTPPPPPPPPPPPLPPRPIINSSDKYILKKLIKKITKLFDERKIIFSTSSAYSPRYTDVNNKLWLTSNSCDHIIHDVLKKLLERSKFKKELEKSYYFKLNEARGRSLLFIKGLTANGFRFNDLNKPIIKNILGNVENKQLLHCIFYMLKLNDTFNANMNWDGEIRFYN